MAHSRLDERLDSRVSSYSAKLSARLPQPPRRTPRVSLIVILPENHVLSADSLAERLPTNHDDEVDVIVACAGQPIDLTSIHRATRRAQFLVAPAGTSSEDLRELAMRRAPGDIVTLVTGALRHVMPSAELELLKTS